MAYCAPCERSFVHNGALAQHVDESMMHRMNLGRYCRTCNLVFTDASALRTHRSIAHTIRQAYCRPCGRYFVDNAALQDHVQFSSAHAPSEPYCRTCDRYFVDDVALQQHLDYSSVHRNDSDDYDDSEDSVESEAYYGSDDDDDEREPYCTTCDRYFATDQALEQHLDTSTAHNFFKAPSAYSIPLRSSQPTLFSGKPTSSGLRPNSNSVPSPVVSKKENRHQPLMSLDLNTLGDRGNSTANNAKANISTNFENPSASVVAQDSGGEKILRVPLAEAIAKCLEREFPQLKGLDGSTVSKALVEDPNEPTGLTASKAVKGLDGFATSTTRTSDNITRAECSVVLDQTSTPTNTEFLKTGQQSQKAPTCPPQLDHKTVPTTVSVLGVQESPRQDSQCTSCNLSFEDGKALSIHIRNTPGHH
ncbi:unnamed protein product, partial [Clonostachys rosea]